MVFKCLFPLAGLPVEPQESPAEIVDIATVRAMFVVAEFFVDHKEGSAAAL